MLRQHTESAPATQPGGGSPSSLILLREQSRIRQSWRGNVSRPHGGRKSSTAAAESEYQLPLHAESLAMATTLASAHRKRRSLRAHFRGRDGKSHCKRPRQFSQNSPNLKAKAE